MDMAYTQYIATSMSVFIIACVLVIFVSALGCCWYQRWYGKFKGHQISVHAPGGYTSV